MFVAPKQTDVVDFGGETDYSGYKWFQDRPPRPQPPPPAQPQAVEYRPSQDVINRNTGIRFALVAAPNVLYQRYKQYGQLGVLAWCSEFSELIDNLKDLGVSGHMFTDTRKDALEACIEIMRLPLEEVKMQLITMYLQSQVARLRRFLQVEGSNDYTEPQFPYEMK